MTHVTTENNARISILSEGNTAADVAAGGELTSQLYTDCPSIAVAYDLSIRSLDAISRRFDSMDANLDKTIVWVSTLTSGIAGLVVTLHKDNISHINTFATIVSTVLFLASLCVAYYGKLAGELIITDPHNLYNDHIDAQETEFKYTQIYYFGEQFQKARDGAFRKWWCNLISLALFSLELIFWVLALQS